MVGTPKLDALAREWAELNGYDLTPQRDLDEPIGAVHVQSMITEHWEKLTDPETYFGFSYGGKAYQEYVAYVRGIQDSWHVFVESKVT